MATDREKKLKIAMNALYYGVHGHEETDYDKLLDKLLKNDVDGRYILEAGIKWPKGKFNFEKAMNAFFGDEIDPGNIYRAGNRWESFDYEKGFDALINSKSDEAPSYVYLSGLDTSWNSFNHEKGFEYIIKKGGPFYIARAGRYWGRGKINYKKGFEELLKKDKTGEHIYISGLSWPYFDHQEAFKVLEKISKEYYDKAKKDWPPTASQALRKIETDAKNTNKAEDKKIVLESLILNEVLRELKNA